MNNKSKTGVVSSEIEMRILALFVVLALIAMNTEFA